MFEFLKRWKGFKKQKADGEWIWAMTRPLKRVMDGGKPISTEAMEREENRQIGQDVIF